MTERSDMFDERTQKLIGKELRKNCEAKKERERLEGMSPAGCQSETGSEARGAAGDQSTTDLTHGGSVRRTEEGVRVRRLLQQWKDEEAEHRENAKHWEDWRKSDLEREFLRKADGLKWRRQQLEAALSPEPLTKSDGNEGDRCPACGSEMVRVFPFEREWECEDCGHHWGTRAGVSGACPPNAEALSSERSGD